jgi:hypothetical protein
MKRLQTDDQYISVMTQILIASHHQLIGDEPIKTLTDLAAKMNDNGYRNRSGKPIKGNSLKQWCVKFRQNPRLIRNYIADTDEMMRYRPNIAVGITDPSLFVEMF